MVKWISDMGCAEPNKISYQVGLIRFVHSVQGAYSVALGGYFACFDFACAG